MLRSNIILRIRAVPGSSLVEAVRERKDFQKVSSSCLINFSTFSRTYAQSLQPWPSPCTFQACFLSTEQKFNPKQCLFIWLLKSRHWLVAISSGESSSGLDRTGQLFCLTSHFALQLIAPHWEEERGKRW